MGSCFLDWMGLMAREASEQGRRHLRCFLKLLLCSTHIPFAKQGKRPSPYQLCSSRGREGARTHPLATRKAISSFYI